jgi:hypothetical protein
MTNQTQIRDEYPTEEQATHSLLAHYRTAKRPDELRYPQPFISALMERHYRWFAAYGWR